MRISPKSYNDYSEIVLLTLFAIPVGIAVGLVDALFGRILIWITDFRMEHPYQLIPFLGIIGVLIVWCYKEFGKNSAKGMSLIFEAGHGTSDNIPLRLIPFSIIGTWLTHLFGGSAGREGVAIQVGGALSYEAGRRILTNVDRKLLLIVGMSAGFGGLFRTPIAAAFFAVEVLTAGVLENKAMLPALAASFTASFTANICGLEKFSFMLSDNVTFSLLLALKLIALGISFGITGRLFTMYLHKLKMIFADRMKNPLIRIFVIGVAVSCFSLLLWNGRYSGLGTNLISMSFDNGIYTWDFALKLVFTVVTLAAGFQGGEVTPLFSIGASLGVVLASILNMPIYFVAALGYSAVFAGATNTLIAPMIIGAEVFGYEYLPYFVIVCAVAYACNGNLSIYSLQKIYEIK